MDKILTGAEIKKIIRESANDFKPILGKNVERDEKKQNQDAIKQMAKDTSEYNPKQIINKTDNEITSTANGGMTDNIYDLTSDGFKKDSMARLKGYASAQNEKLHKNDKLGNGFHTSDKFIKNAADHAKKRKDIKDKLKHVGLTSKYEDKPSTDSTMFESKTVDKLVFHTKFLSESNMMGKIPDEYKKEGKKFIMADNSGNSYLIEWHSVDQSVIEEERKQAIIKEQENKIKRLFNLPKPEYNAKASSLTKSEEDQKFKEILSKSRKLYK